MKYPLCLTLLACCISAAHADDAVVSASSAASAPLAASEAVASPEVAPPTDGSTNSEAVQIEGVHDGQIQSISGCGETNHTALKSFVAARAVVSGLGLWFLNFVPNPKVRYDQKCVVVTFPDGTADQVATFPSKDYDPKSIALNQAVSVRFEGGKPIFPWASAH